MYQVLAFRSHADVRETIFRDRLTFTRLEDALLYREASDCPIVDVVDVGEPGRCPRRPVTGDGPQGHRFDVQSDPVACSDCGAHMDALYVAGTYLPKEADR